MSQVYEGLGEVKSETTTLNEALRCHFGLNRESRSAAGRTKAGFEWIKGKARRKEQQV